MRSKYYTYVNWLMMEKTEADIALIIARKPTINYASTGIL